MPIYDSIVTAMGCAGTGGFAVYNDSIAHYNSSLITNIVSVAVLLFGINFNLYYFLLLRKFKAFFKDEELRHISASLSLLRRLFGSMLVGYMQVLVKDWKMHYLKLLM